MSIARMKKLHAVLFVFATAASSVSAQTPPTNGKPEEKRDISTTKVDLQTCKPATGKTPFFFDKASIQEILEPIARMRCMNFILSDQVKGKNDISIISRTPVTVAQAYAAFLSALEANGMSLVPAGAYWKVVERKDAAKTTLPLYDIGKDGVLQKITPKEGRAGDFPNSDAHVTLLYEVRYANKDQVQQLIRNLMTKNADLQAPGGSLLILSDSGSNILRILEVLDKIDIQGSSNQLNVYTPEYADVASIQSRLQEIFGVGDKGGAAPTGKAPKVKKKDREKAALEAEGAAVDDDFSGDVTDVVIDKIIADERTNQLIIVSSPKSYERALEVIKILDVMGPDGSGGGVRMWVVPLANADAQKAASTLSSLATGAGAKKTGADAKAGVKAKEQAQAAALFEGDVKVTADETTNALVVVASARDFRALRSVIEQLDVRRPQVFVEAAILEVAVNQNRNVGLSAYGSAPLDVPIPGSTGPGILTFANEGGKALFGQGARVASGIALLQALERSGRLDQSSAALGLELVDSLSQGIGLFSFTGPAITLIEDAAGNPIVSFPSVGAVVNLLQGNSNVDILSTPHLMTTDNEKAELSVGDRVPVNKGTSFTGAGGLGLGAQQQITYEEVKLKFTITPHVNADDEVRVELEQEVSDISGQVNIGGVNNPIISSRTVKSVVVTADQRTVVIGGLMQDKKSDSESKVPFFGDIPVIGWLFKNWSDTSKKTNLILLLTPYIVRDEEDFRKIYDLKMKERQAFIDSYFTDARRYDPFIDYERKTGPLGKLVQAIDLEMQRIENGGKGIEGEELLGPANFGDRKVGNGHDGHDTTEPDGDGDGGTTAPEGGGEVAPPPPTTPPPAAELPPPPTPPTPPN
ncbi:MAG: type II secretion system secretin GspD [Deltaproteobacteria bacterium]|nr:type II secretion system secretin GspD [Deltaproteobacteria bacterium]